MTPGLRRWTRRLALAIVALLGVVVLAVGLLQVPAVSTWAGRQLIDLVPLRPGYRIEVRRVTGSWLAGLTLHDLRLRHDGRELVSVASLRVRYDPRNLIGAERRIRALVVDGARVVARREDGAWDIAGALETSPDTAAGPGTPVVLERVEVRNTTALAILAPDSTVAVDELFLRAHDIATGDSARATIDTLHARIHPTPGPSPLDLTLSGTVTPELVSVPSLRLRSRHSDITARVIAPRQLDDAHLAEWLDVELYASPLALADVAAFVPAVPGKGRVILEASAMGDGSRIHGNLDASGSRIDTMTIERLRLATVYADGRADIALNGAAAGAAWRTDGWIRPFDSLPSYALSGTARDLPGTAAIARALSKTPGDSSLTIDFDLAGQGFVPESTTIALRAMLEGDRLGLAMRAGPFDSIVPFDGTIRIDVGSVALAGEAQPFDSTPSVAIHRGRARLESPDGTLVSNFTARFIGPPYPQFETRGEVTVARPDRPATTPHGQFDARFALHGSADSVGLLTLGGRIDAAGAVGDVRVDSMHVALAPQPGVVMLDTLLLHSNVAFIAGGGRVALREGVDSSALRVVGALGDIAPLAALAGFDSVSLDSARFAVHVTGPASHRRVDGNLDAHQLYYAGNQVDRLIARGGATIDSAGIGGMAGEARVTGVMAGTFEIPEAQIAARYDSIASLDATATLPEDIRLVTALAGTVTEDTVRARLEQLDLIGPEDTWSLARPTPLLLRPRVEVHDFALVAGDQRLAVDGVVDPRDTSNISVRLANIGLDLLRRLEVVPIGGTIDGEFHLAGPGTKPTVNGTVAWELETDNRKDVGRVEVDVDWTGAGLRLDGTAAHRTGGAMTLAGTVPLRLTLTSEDTVAAGVTRIPDAELDLTLRADSIALAIAEPMLPPETVRDLRGTATVNGHVGGSLDEPRLEGTFGVSGFHATLATLGVMYDGGVLNGRLTNEVIQIERLRLATGNGELTATGAIRLDSLTNPSFDIAARLREFQVSRSDPVHTAATGTVEVGGTLERPSLTGKLRLGHTEIVLGAGAAAADVEHVELTDEDLAELASVFGPSVLERAGEPDVALLDRLAIDLQLVFPGDVWFHRRTSPQIDMELSGRMTIRQAPGGPMRFYGEVEPTPGRGFLELYGRTFQFIDGEVQLAGPADSVTLDVTAEYEVPTSGGPEDAPVLVTVNAAGRPDNLQLTFGSDPEMPEDDIISYIITGRPASDNPLLAGGGGGISGTEFAAEQAIGALSGAAGEALGLDVFRVEQDGTRGLTLTAGRYVAPRLFVSLQQPIQLSSQAHRTPGHTAGAGFEIEYTLRRWLRANLRGGNLPVRFFLRGRHAY